MNRSHSTEAIVLRTSRIGEIHRGVVMLTPDEGLVRAIAHGANTAKGKLRGSTVPFCSGRAYLYINPATQSTKITDMDADEFFSGIRGDLKKFYTACLWAELILKTFASGGAAAGLFMLFRSALGELDQRAVSVADLVSVQFIWRFLALSGFQPDLDICACSGEHLAPEESAYYSRSEDGFCAESHASAEPDTDEQLIRWSPGALGYLRHTADLSLSEALRVAPPVAAVPAFKRVLYTIIQDLVEAPLNTIRTGSGII
ncbi:MAG: DNA repair protein RecO [Spirochaetia bacterium]